MKGVCIILLLCLVHTWAMDDLGSRGPLKSQLSPGPASSSVSHASDADPLVGCYAHDQLTQFLSRSYLHRCRAVPVTGAFRTVFCYNVIGGLACDIVGSELFYAFAHLPMDHDTVTSHSFSSKEHLNAFFAKMNKSKVPRVHRVTVQFDGRQTKGRACGFNHVFAVVHWPEAGAPGPGAEQRQSMCLLQSYRAGKVGYTLRQWAYGYHHDHAEQAQSRGDFTDTDPVLFEAARQAWVGKRDWLALRALLEKLLEPATAREAFTSLSGCDPKGDITVRHMMTQSANVASESGIVSGFKEMTELANTMCEHERSGIHDKAPQV